MQAGRAHTLFSAAALIAAALSATGCAGPLHSMPGTFAARTVPLEIAGRELNVTYVKPTVPRTQELLILFASGDAGYRGVSGAIMKHLAEQRYYLVTYDARELIAREKKSGTRAKIQEVAAVFETILVDARRSQRMPDDAPVVVIGYSRGANMVVLSAGIDSLRQHLAGAVAIELTRTTEFLEVPRPEDPHSSVLLGDDGHIKTYAAIPLAESLPFALIQATNDSYIGADEARQLFGPDTPSRRFYRIEGDHALRRAHDEVMHSLDDALAWILGIAGTN